MCPPQLLFIPDADEDGTPDGPAQVVLDGFDVAQDNYHNFANGLRWGPDGCCMAGADILAPADLGFPALPKLNACHSTAAFGGTTRNDAWWRSSVMEQQILGTRLGQTG